MAIKSRNKKATAISAGGILFSGMWKALQWSITAATLPDDAAAVWKMLVTAPSLIPWVILLGCIVLFVWSLWPNEEGDEDGAPSSTVFNNPKGVNIGTVGGDFNQHNHAAPEKFRSKQEVNNLSPPMGGNQALDLGGVATLRLGNTYSARHVDMQLDVVPHQMQVETSPGIEVDGATIFYGEKKTLVFNDSDKKRHLIDIGGSVFVITLLEIDPRPIEGVSRPFRWFFSVVEK